MTALGQMADLTHDSRVQVVLISQDWAETSEAYSMGGPEKSST